MRQRHVWIEKIPIPAPYQNAHIEVKLGRRDRIIHVGQTDSHSVCFVFVERHGRAPQKGIG